VAALLADGDEQADRLAVVDAVIVDPVLEAPFAVGQLRQRGARQPLRIVDDFLEIKRGLLRPVARDDLGELLLGDVAGGKLRAQIAEGLNVAAAYKSAVESAVASGKPLGSITSATLDVSLPDTAKYVGSVQVVRGAIDIHYGRSANQRIAGGHLVLIPGIGDGRQVKWTCGHASPFPDAPPSIDDYQKYTNIPDSLLPSACRLAYMIRYVSH